MSGSQRLGYTEWDAGRQGVELYDYQHDPRELRNRADDPQSADTVAELKIKA